MNDENCGCSKAPTAGEVRLCKEIDGIFRSSIQPLSMASMRRLFLLFTQAHFSNPEHYGYLKDNLCALFYNADDPDKSPLQVELTNVYDSTKDAPFKPAVYVRFNALKMDKQVINNSAGLDGGIGDRDHFTQKATGELTLVALHQEFDLASLLAESAYVMFMGLRVPLMQQLGLNAFDGLGFAKGEERGTPPTRLFSVEAKFQVEFQFNVDQILEGHLLKKVAIYAKLK